MEATMGGANCFDEELDYSSLRKIFFTEEDASSTSSSITDLMLQFFHGEDVDAAAALFTNGCHDDTIFWPLINNQNVAAADTFLDYNVVSQESSSGVSNGCFYLNQLPGFDDWTMDLSRPLMIGTIQENNIGSSETDIQNAMNSVVADVKPKKRKVESTPVDGGQTNHIGSECSEIPNNKNNKKTRVARNAQKNKKNVEPIKSRKNKKEKQIVNSKEEEEKEDTVNGGQKIIGQSSSCCYSSEDDSNASEESNADDKTSGPALNLNGKTRATRGAATDPQSLYARRRRERINERLRILQNLIPNGTKVDISTMLEEAVHYVKFLQLQIKLLSSDDMWMYAPVVYNGLDIGQFGKIFPTL